MTTHSPDVLIVGAGPTGLLMAAELARHGVTVRVIDRSKAASEKSKALGIHARTLEIFEDLGIAGRFIELGHKVFAMNIFAHGKRIAHLGTEDLDSPYPYVLALPQCDTEKLLAEHLASFAVEVERAVALSDLRQDSDGITATLVDEQGNHSTCRASWVIGCDGAHSTVRKALGLEYSGVDIETPFVFADVHMEWNWPDDEGYSFFSPQGVLMALAVPRLGDSYYRVVASMEPGGVPDELNLDFFQRLMNERAEVDATLSEPLWMTSFVVRQRKVATYRQGRVFVAGDAAHCHSPVGGQGMNTGLQDAYNLAWKLALVIRDAGRPELLDSYDREREPIATTLLQGTEQTTRAVVLRNPLAQALRNQVARFLISFEVVQQRMTESISEISINYRDSPIVGEDRKSLLRATFSSEQDAEDPSFGQRREFGSGPRPGDRAPDVELTHNSTSMRLFELLRGTKHSLLLFDGVAATPEGYRNLARIAGHMAERYSEHIQVHVIVPHDTRPDALTWQGSVILDHEGAVHDRYGASAECLYLIRPDGYVGYRAQPADADKLLAYLETIFV